MKGTKSFQENNIEFDQDKKPIIMDVTTSIYLEARDVMARLVVTGRVVPLLLHLQGNIII